MSVNPSRFAKRPDEVLAVIVTEDNMHDVADWINTKWGGSGARVEPYSDDPNSPHVIRWTNYSGGLTQTAHAGWLVCGHVYRDYDGTERISLFEAQTEQGFRMYWAPSWLDEPEPAPTLPPSSRQRGTVTAKAVHDRRPSSADETDLRDDGGIGG